MKNNTTDLKNKSENRQSAVTNLFLVLCFVMCSLYIPISIFITLGEWLTLALALLVGVLGIIALARAAGSFRAVAGFALTVGVLAFLGDAFLPLALFVAFISSGVLYAAVCERIEKWLAVPLPLLPSIGMLFISRDIFCALLSLAAVPIGIALLCCTKKKLGRASAVCRISIGICVWALLLAAIAVYRFAGSVSVSAVKELIEIARLQTELMLRTMLSDMQSMLDMGLGGFDSDSAVAAIVASVFNLLPAIIITAANIISYLLHSLWLSVKYGSVKNKSEALPQLALDMSPISAIVYILSLVLSLVLVGNSTALFGAAAENMLVILCPGLVLTALAGIRVLSAAKGPSCLGTLLYIGLICALASLSPIVILITALVGAVLILVNAFARRKDSNN